MRAQNDARPARGIGRRILVVDSDPSVAQMLCALLAEDGHVTSAVTHSLRVLDAAHAFGPDLILMELMLPYLNAIDQIKLLSLEERTAVVPVIVMAASRESLDGIGGVVGPSAVDQIRKPIDRTELLRKIAAAPLPAPSASLAGPVAGTEPA